MNKKYFGTDGIRGKVGESLITPEFALTRLLISRNVTKILGSLKRSKSSKTTKSYFVDWKK